MQKGIFLIIIMSGLLFPISSFAQTQEIISVTTSEPTYEQGEIIVISGDVSAIIGETPVTIQIFFGTTLVEIAQLSVAQDGSYTHTVITEGPLWGNGGEYTIRATYGEGNIAEASFEFVTQKTLSETNDNFEVDAGTSGTFDVAYTIRGGTVENMIIDPDIFALIVLIDSENDGSITLDLPRDSIDAKKSSGSDDTYIILIDGIEV
ncbi:MAG: PEFG-CTERM sorting domain-containing protein, partial [Nitrosopumilaceae archaeon]|nr:PEFG-CTERM sorting domain-containing protein [Nitrosopumilaceae archaeon]